MLKLKQLQQQKQKAAQQQGATADQEGQNAKGEPDKPQTTNLVSNGPSPARAKVEPKNQDVGVMSLSRGTNKNKTKRQNAVELRVQKGTCILLGGGYQQDPQDLHLPERGCFSDLAEMDPVPGTDVDLPDPDNLMKLKVKVTPSDGLYAGATFNFDIDVPNTYPYDPPKVICVTSVRLLLPPLLKISTLIWALTHE